MKTILSIIIISLAFSGCAVKESYVIDPNNKKWIVGLRNDAKVAFTHPDGTTLEVDNRGKESVIEGALKIWTVQVLKDDD